jgi:DNA-binding transcriptional MerR regulator
MPQLTNYITLKQAAQQLGVHEQTLRSWERQGLIHLARLPKSGYRRVPVEEVQRVQTAMHSSQPVVGVRMEPPQRDATALAQAQSLATTVRAELVDLAPTLTFDEFMQTRRGRTWLPMG